MFGGGLDESEYVYMPESRMARARLQEEGLLPSEDQVRQVDAYEAPRDMVTSGDDTADGRLEPDLQRTARQFAAGTEVARLREALQLSRDSLATSNAFIQSTAGEFMAERLDERLSRRRPASESQSGAT